MQREVKQYVAEKLDERNALIAIVLTLIYKLFIYKF